MAELFMPKEESVLPILQPLRFDAEHFDAFIRSRPSVPEVRMYLATYSGEVLHLTWPAGCSIFLHSGELLNMLTDEVLHIMSLQICCPEQIVQFGCLLDHPSRATPRASDAVICIGVKTGSVYASYRFNNNGVYRVADNVEQLLAQGLRKYHDLYLHPVSRTAMFIVRGPNIGSLMDHNVPLHVFAQEHRNTLYALNFPPVFFLQFGHGDEDPHAKTFHPATFLPLYHLATFGTLKDVVNDPTNLEVMGRIYMNRGETEFFVRHEVTGDMVFLTSDRWSLLKLGIRPFVSRCRSCNFTRYVQKPYETAVPISSYMESPPSCRFSPTIKPKQGFELVTDAFARCGVQPIPAARCIHKVLTGLDLLSAFGGQPTAERVMETVKSLTGAVLRMSWPFGFSVVIGSWEGLWGEDRHTPCVGPLKVPSWVAEVSRYLCCADELVCIGYVSCHEYNICAMRDDPRILLGIQTGAIYAAYPDCAALGIWRIAESFCGLAAHGLTRLTPIYTHPGVQPLPLFIVSGPDLNDMWNPVFGNKFYAFSRKHEDQAYGLAFPPGFYFYFGTGGSQPYPHPRVPFTLEGLVHVGRVCPGGFSDAGGKPVVVARVYVSAQYQRFYARDEVSGEIIFLASAFWEFMTIGVRLFFENHSYGPTCLPHRSVRCHVCGRSKYMCADRPTIRPLEAPDQGPSLASVRVAPSEGDLVQSGILPETLTHLSQ